MGDRTKLQLGADRRSLQARRAIGAELRSNREDQGLGLRTVATVAGIDPSHLARIELGAVAASLEALQRVAAALGGECSIRYFPGTGIRLRDRHQAAIIEALAATVHPVWKPSIEVPVLRPARGVIDVVLARIDLQLAVAGEVHSEIRRLEQILRWGNQKRESLPSSDLWQFLAATGTPPATSSLLVLRSTAATRAVARSHPATLAAAFLLGRPMRGTR